ncbi:hypothetical protein [Tistrella mobilis]|jgi:metal-responsive CopG/Arc/MetJ family transcriptional regulator
MVARFPEGTFARIAAVLRDEDDRADFVREAVEKLLQEREAKARGEPRA